MRSHDCNDISTQAALSLAQVQECVHESRPPPLLHVQQPLQQAAAKALSICKAGAEAGERQLPDTRIHVLRRKRGRRLAPATAEIVSLNVSKSKARDILF